MLRATVSHELHAVAVIDRTPNIIDVTVNDDTFRVVVERERQ
jgi:hypothetical protein